MRTIRAIHVSPENILQVVKKSDIGNLFEVRIKTDDVHIKSRSTLFCSKPADSPATD
jgi:hypothetical protein